MYCSYLIIVKESARQCNRPLESLLFQTPTTLPALRLCHPRMPVAGIQQKLLFEKTNPIDTLLHRLGCRPERVERVEGSPFPLDKNEKQTQSQNRQTAVPSDSYPSSIRDLPGRQSSLDASVPCCPSALLPWPLIRKNKPNRHPSTSPRVSSRASGTSRGSSPPTCKYGRTPPASCL